MTRRLLRRKAVVPALAPFLAACMAVLTAACTVGPDYEPSQPELPAAYDAPVPAMFEVGAPMDGPWWRLYGDETLNALIGRAAGGNLDIRLAERRMREARALARGVDSQAVPQVDGSGEAGGDWVIQDDDDSDTGVSGFLAGAIGAVWDLDLFGRLSRSREAAWAVAEQQGALARDAARVVAGAVAETYIALRGTERRLWLARQALALQRRTLDLVVERTESGLAPGLDRVRAEAEVASLAADVGPLESQADRLRNALAVLVGATPGALDSMLAQEDADIPFVGTGAPIGIPRNLVRRRADIQAAELAIAAATADVGVATAELYPSLVLPGTITATRTDIGTDSAATSVVASLSALVDVPLFDGGLRRANLTAAEERLAQAIITYRAVLLAALEEVEAALLDYRAAFARRVALEEAVAKSREAYEQSRELYREGFASFLDIVDSQRQWNESLQDLTDARRDLSIAVAALYTALGGDAGAAL